MNCWRTRRQVKRPKSPAVARFHLKDGRELRFTAVPNSILRRRTGELLFAALALALLGAVLFFGWIAPEARAARNDAAPPRREVSALR